jgi:hypothetical protein
MYLADQSIGVLSTSSTGFDIFICFVLCVPLIIFFVPTARETTTHLVSKMSRKEVDEVAEEDNSSEIIPRTPSRSKSKKYLSRTPPTDRTKRTTSSDSSSFSSRSISDVERGIYYTTRRSVDNEDRRCRYRTALRSGSSRSSSHRRRHNLMNDERHLSYPEERYHQLYSPSSSSSRRRHTSRRKQEYRQNDNYHRHYPHISRNRRQFLKGSLLSDHESEQHYHGQRRYEQDISPSVSSEEEEEEDQDDFEGEKSTDEEEKEEKGDVENSITLVDNSLDFSKIYQRKKNRNTKEMKGKNHFPGEQEEEEEEEENVHYYDNELAQQSFFKKLITDHVHANHSNDCEEEDEENQNIINGLNDVDRFVTEMTNNLYDHHIEDEEEDDRLITEMTNNLYEDGSDSEEEEPEEQAEDAEAGIRRVELVTSNRR